MSRRAGRIGIAASVKAGLRAAIVRPRVVLALLLVNLMTAWLLALPFKAALSDNLDGNLFSETMAEGPSWRWFDTVDRLRPDLLGDLDVVDGALGEEGVTPGDLRGLSGPVAMILLAALFSFWINALLHCGFLASHGGKHGGFLAATGRFAVPASILAAIAFALFAGIYFLLYSLTGHWFEDTRDTVDREWWAIIVTWGRLGATLLALLLVKVVYDLAKVVLVVRDTLNWPWAGILALRETLRRADQYLGLRLVLGLGTPLLFFLWWLVPGRIVPLGWLTLGLVFFLQQGFMASRIVLRLSQLAAARALYESTLEAEAEKQPPFKVEVPGRE